MISCRGEAPDGTIYFSSGPYSQNVPYFQDFSAFQKQTFQHFQPSQHFQSFQMNNNQFSIEPFQEEHIFPSSGFLGPQDSSSFLLVLEEEIGSSYCYTFSGMPFKRRAKKRKTLFHLEDKNLGW